MKNSKNILRDVRARAAVQAEIQAFLDTLPCTLDEWQRENGTSPLRARFDAVKLKPLLKW